MKDSFPSQGAEVGFIEQCLKEQTYAPAVLQKIVDKKLILTDYKLNQSVSRAIKAALLRNTDMLRSLYLDNCGCTDEQLAEILEGCGAQKHFVSLKVKN